MLLELDQETGTGMGIPYMVKSIEAKELLRREKLVFGYYRRLTEKCRSWLPAGRGDLKD